MTHIKMHQHCDVIFHCASIYKRQLQLCCSIGTTSESTCFSNALRFRRVVCTEQRVSRIVALESVGHTRQESGVRARGVGNGGGFSSAAVMAGWLASSLRQSE